MFGDQFKEQLKTRLKRAWQWRWRWILFLFLIGVVLSIIGPSLGMADALLCLIHGATIAAGVIWGVAGFGWQGSPIWRKIRFFDTADRDAVPVDIKKIKHPQIPTSTAGTVPAHKDLVPKLTGKWWEDRPIENPFDTTTQALNVAFVLDDGVNPTGVNYDVLIDPAHWAPGPIPPNEYISEVWILVGPAPPESGHTYEIGTVIRHGQDESEEPRQSMHTHHC